MSRNRRIAKSRRGAIAVFAAVCMVMMMAMVAFAVDLGNVCRIKGETQAVADAAALAAARGLTDGTAQAKGIAAAKANTANGNSVTLTNSNVVLGTWSTSSRSFTAGGSPSNAVQVTVPLTSAANNPVSTAFARIFGINNVNVSSSAIATGGRWDIVLAIDRTSSFQNDLAQGTAGMQAVLDYLNTYSPSSNLGIVTFNGVGYTNASLQPVGTNYSTLKTAISSIQDCAVGGPPCSGSDLAAGMETAISLFSASGYSPPTGTRKAVIFISDGAANMGSKCLHKTLNDTQDNDLAATDAQNAYSNNGISVFSLLYYGSGDTSTDTEAMQDLVSGSGIFINEPTASQLTNDLNTMLISGMSMTLAQ